MLRFIAPVFGVALLIAPSLAAPAGPTHFLITQPADLGPSRANGLTPTVIATIGGVQGKFVFDTGAGGMIVSERLAARMAVGGTDNARVTDSTNRRIKGALLHNVPLLLGDGPERIMANVVAVPLPPIEVMGFDGVMSPQALAGDGCTVIDFARGEGWVVAAGDPKCDAAAEHSVTLTGNKGKLPMVLVFDGDSKRRAAFVADSGAALTSVSFGFARAVPVLRSGTTRGLADQPEATDVIGPVCLKIGGHAAVLPEAERRLVRWQPNLGFDVLKDVRMVLRADGSGFMIVAPSACPPGEKPPA